MHASDDSLRKRALAWFYRLARRAITCDLSRLMVLDRVDMREIAVDSEARYRFLSPSDVETFADDPANELTSEFTCRLASGRDRCYAALLRGRLAAYIWLATGSIEAEHNRGRTAASGVPISFPANSVFVYKAYTRSEYRGRRLYAALLAGAMRELTSEGVTRLITTADWTNDAAVAACRRLGFRELGKIGRYACGGCSMTSRPPEARELGIRIGRQARGDVRRMVCASSFADITETLAESSLSAV
jgi:hypothetical protein